MPCALSSSPSSMLYRGLTWALVDKNYRDLKAIADDLSTLRPSIVTWDLICDLVMQRRIFRLFVLCLAASCSGLQEHQLRKGF